MPKRSRAVTAGPLTVLTAQYFESIFCPNAASMCHTIASFGGRRWQTVPPQQLSTEERVRLAFEYNDLEQGLFGRKGNRTVKELACMGMGAEGQANVQAGF